MKESDLTDVTIVSDDKKHFNAHKIVLKACSSVFQNIIEDLPQTNSVIYLRGIQYQEIESILEYMYLGEVTISQQRVYQFLKVAADLEVKNFDKENTDSTSIVTDTSEPMSDINEMGALNQKVEHNVETIFENTIPLQECEESAIKEDQLKNDMDVSNNSNQKYHEVNDLKLAYRSNQKFIMNRHISLKEKVIVYACNQCEVKCSSRYSLTRHIQSQHEEENIEYACNQCEVKCSSRSNLTRHIQSQHEEKVFPCDQCDKYFKRKDSLKEHYQADHDKIELVCKFCDYSASYRQDVRKHMKIKHNMNTDSTSIITDTHEPMSDTYEMVEASNPKDELNDDIILENTIPSTENRNKKLEESDSANIEEQLKINMDFSNNTNMKSHEESDMKLAYKCNQCDFKAPYKFIMKKHIRVNHADLKSIYDDLKEFSCNQCESKFSCRSNVTRHIQSQHGEKAFSCDQCEKQFRRKDSLEEHCQAAHDKIKYVCKICDHTTSYRRDLKYHMKIRHNMSVSINPGN